MCAHNSNYDFADVLYLVQADQQAFLFIVESTQLERQNAFFWNKISLLKNWNGDP